MNGWIFDPRVALAIEQYITCPWERFMLSLTCRAGKKYYFDASVLKKWRILAGLEPNVVVIGTCFKVYRIMIHQGSRAYAIGNYELLNFNRHQVVRLHRILSSECSKCQHNPWELPDKLLITASWSIQETNDSVLATHAPLGTLLL